MKNQIKRTGWQSPVTHHFSSDPAENYEVDPLDLNVAHMIAQFAYAGMHLNCPLVLLVHTMVHVPSIRTVNADYMKRFAVRIILTFN